MATLIHPHIKGGVEARAYQLRATKDALSCSTLMVMPTGFGKTAVEWMAMAEYIDKEGKILLIAPSTGLIHQHAQMVSEKLVLTEDDICILTGDIKPQKRPALWNDAKLILATPQVIRNDSRNGIIDIREVALRKSLFFKTMLPLVLQVNEEILKNRRRLWFFQYQINLGKKPGPEDRLWLIGMMERYGLKKAKISANWLVNSGQ